MLICEPYKTEIGQHWRFKNVAVAKESSEKITGLFHSYLAKGEFVGADLTRKYLQMVFTRARVMPIIKSGKKYDKEHKLCAARAW